MGFQLWGGEEMGMRGGKGCRGCGCGWGGSRRPQGQSRLPLNAHLCHLHTNCVIPGGRCNHTVSLMARGLRGIWALPTKPVR